MYAKVKLNSTWYTRLWRQAPQHSNSCTIGPFSSEQFSAAAIRCYCLHLSSSYRNILMWGYVMVSFQAGSTAWGAPKQGGGGALHSDIFLRISFIIHLLINLAHLHPRPFVRLLHVAGNLALFAQRTGVVRLRPHHGKGALDSKLPGASSPGPLLL